MSLGMILSILLVISLLGGFCPKAQWQIVNRRSLYQPRPDGSGARKTM